MEIYEEKEKYLESLNKVKIDGNIVDGTEYF